MYCPVDGDEFREGITRCPEHDVDLVEDPPDVEEDASWIDRFNDRTAVRVAFIVFIITAIVYAITGFATIFLYLMIQLRRWDAYDTANLFQQIQSAMFPVAVVALGVLAGALLLRTYLLLSTTGRPPSEGPGSTVRRSSERPLPHAIVRLLLALTIAFALLWAGTGIAISREEVEYRTQVDFGTQAEEPDDSFITLSALHYVAWVGGVSSLAIMGAGLIARAHARRPL